MPKSRIRRKNRGADAARSARSVRSVRVQERQAAELFGPLDPDQVVEAEGYLLEAISNKRAQLAAELADLRGRLAALPLPAPVDSAAWVEANALDDEIVHIGDALVELDDWVDAVRNRRSHTVPMPLGILTLRAARHRLHADAERLGVEVDPVALAESMRRDALVSRWLMNHAGEADVEAVPALRAAPPPARP